MSFYISVLFSSQDYQKLEQGHPKSFAIRKTRLEMFIVQYAFIGKIDRLVEKVRELGRSSFWKFFFLSSNRLDQKFVSVQAFNFSS